MTAARIHEIAIGMRFCAVCGTDKPLDDFPLCYRAATKVRPRGWGGPRRRCASCWSEFKTQQYAANLLSRAYISGISNARRRGATQFLSLAEWRALNAVTACHWCSLTLHRSFTHFDHVTPLSLGGQHTADNLVASCANCNMRRAWEMRTKYKEGR